MKPGAVEGQVESSTEEPDGLVVSGWAVEANHQRVPSTILVLVGNEVVTSGKPTVFRRDIAKRFNVPQLFLSGFKINVPSSVLKGRKPVRVLALSHDGVASEIVTAQGSR